MIVARSPRGEFAIMEGHAPLLAVLDGGPIRIHTNGVTRVFAARRGTLRVADDRVSLLVETAVPLEEIDLGDIAARLPLLQGSEESVDVEEREYLALLRAVKERYG